jgi:hypothetical protein
MTASSSSVNVGNASLDAWDIEGDKVDGEDGVYDGGVRCLLKLTSSVDAILGIALANLPFASRFLGASVLGVVLSCVARFRSPL